MAMIPSVPVQFIRCTSEQIQELISKNMIPAGSQEQMENSTEKVAQETSENSIKTEEK